MIERSGLDTVHAYMRHIQTAAEHKMRAALARIDDGVHRFEDHLDDGSAIRLALEIDGDRATIDFTGTDPVLPGNLNANRAIVSSAVLYCLRCLIDDDLPLNAGVLAPISIVLPRVPTCTNRPRRSAKKPGVRGRQRGDIPARGRRAVRRARRRIRQPGDHEQRLLRRRDVRILRDDLRAARARVRDSTAPTPSTRT